MRTMFCTLALLVLATPLLASDPFAGTWVSNAAKTKYTTGLAPKSVTIVIQEQGTDLMVTATGSASDGSPVAVKYTVPVKGGAGTVEQGDFDAITAKQESDRVREYLYEGWEAGSDAADDCF